MRLQTRRKPSPAAELRESLRKARADAPTLRDSFPAAVQVSVELSFNADACLEPAPQHFTVFPPAQAHFIYACAFGDCDGRHNLNDTVFTMLGAGTSRIRGELQCTGHRGAAGPAGSLCGLGVQYILNARYRTAAPAPASSTPGTTDDSTAR
jgi:hypothetical protein